MYESVYIPVKTKILETKNLTKFEKFFKLDLSNFSDFQHDPGQFVQVAIPGVGEAPISIASYFDKGKTLDLVVRKVGSLTGVLHTKEKGDYIGLRGPFGHGFPMEKMKGKHIVIIAGGIGLVPLRSVIQYYIENKNDYKGMTILYGTRTPQDLLFKDEYDEWKKHNINILMTVDKGDETWKGKVGMILVLFPELNINPDETVGVICGPPVMYRCAIEQIKNKGVTDENIYISLERNMKCGVGKCAHCAFGSYHVCIDGPVFTYEFLKDKKEAF